MTTQYSHLINTESKSALVKSLQDWRSPVSDYSAETFVPLLNSMDPKSNTLAYAQVLVDALGLAVSVNEFETLAEPLSRFATQIQLEQVESFPEILRRLTRALAQMAQLSENSAQACTVLVDMVGALNQQMELTRLPPMTIEDIIQHKQRLGVGSSHGVRLTPLHIECLRQCLLARRRWLYERVANEVVATRLDAIGRLDTQRLRPFLEYHHYAGMVCAGLGHMEQALQMWRMVFAVPTRFVSAIQIASFKRFTLAHAIVHGKRGTLPSMFVPAHVRTIESVAAAYVALADVCASRQLGAAVKAVHDMNSELFSDGNTGLAQRLLDELPAHCVRACADVYTRLPLKHLAQVVKFSDYPRGGAGDDADDVVDALGRYIQEMNDPCVVLEETDAGIMVVRFVDAQATVPLVQGAAQSVNIPGVPLEKQWSVAIAARAQEANVLQKYLQELDHHLALTRDYVSRSRDV
ncbi:COP9 signalosome complex subunit 3 [Coemansia sp. RSA 1939]|nr:COP9 signalosome complex subunit 3 [Coemansia sp. RSA 1939]KAJ2680860.1 COP9 signalosome complex subunit 3 [Coemansia sp. RSA 1285]